MSKHGLVILQLAVVFSLLACTSSNTPTGAQSGTGYDSQYNAATRSAGSYGADQSKQLEATGDAPLTIMYIAAETGDMYPGEDYYIYAVVDKPKDREDMEYSWSVANGTISEVPEAQRGRLQKLVEDGYATATAAPAAETPAAETPAAGETPAEGTPAPGTPAPGTPAPGNPASGPPGSALPGASGSSDQQAVTPPSGSAPAWVKDAPMDIQRIFKLSEAGAKVSEEDAIKLKDYIAAQGPQPPMNNGVPVSMVHERRMVGGPETGDEAAAADGKQPAEDGADADAAEEAAGTEPASDEEFIGPQRPEPAGAANVGEEATKPVKAKSGASEKSKAEEDLRAEYKTLKDGDGDERRRGLGSYGADEDAIASDEELTAEASYELSTLSTAEPFIMWTPDKPGNAKIFLKLAWKEDDLTEPRELDVEVRLRDPEVKLGDDFPDVVNEDDTFVVKLDGSGIPAFQKGLFTITYDINKLSFRDAQLGEFFDDASNSSIYYAQPDKTDGKVLIAVDTNSEITDLSGDGPLIYMKFKAKADLAKQEDTQLAMVTDTSARYILNADGDNVLPVPVERPAYKTEVVMPPVTEYKRDNTAGQGLPATPGQANPATPGTPAAGGAAGNQQQQQGGILGGSGGSQTPVGGQSNNDTNKNDKTDDKNNVSPTQTGKRGSSADEAATDDSAAANSDTGSSAASGDDTFVGPEKPKTDKNKADDKTDAKKKDASNGADNTPEDEATSDAAK
jgi:hypothetical protein